MAQAPDNQSSITGAQELTQDASALAALGSNRPTLNAFA